MIRILALAAALALGPNLAASESSPALNNFLLEDAGGARRALYDAEPGTRGTVLAFTGVECPIAKLYGPRLAELHEEYGPEGIRFLGIDPNYQDKPDEIRARAAAVGIQFPILRDPFQVVTHELAVTRTTEVFLLDQDFEVVYRGALDDQYGVGTQKPFPRNEYLIEAVEALLAGEEPETQRTDAPGCLIASSFNTDLVELEYHRDIEPILRANCMDCHRPGQIGPMSFLTYEDAASWAPMIAEVVEQGRMPPWHANPRHGRFLNERRLSATEKAMLTHWAQSGARRGSAPEAPPALPSFADGGWAIGEPDVIVELPEVQKIPATGVVDYRYVLVDPGLKEDVWIQAAEIRPSHTARKARSTAATRISPRRWGSL